MLVQSNEHDHACLAEPLLLQVLNQLLLGISYMAVWVKLPYTDEYSSDGKCDIWTWWNTLRSLCRYHPLLGTCLELWQNLPSQPFGYVPTSADMYVIAKTGES